MSELSIPERIAADTEHGKPTHIVCCDQDTALCGEGVSNHPYVDGTDRMCVPCEVLEEALRGCPCRARFRQGAVS